MSATLIIVGILVVLVLWFTSVYNSLIRARNKVTNAFAQIDTQLQRRFDLIPNLVETVKGYAAHEEGTLTKVTELRTKFLNSSTPSEKIEVENQLNTTLKTLFSVTEAYPDLKANTNFMQLQEELKNTEDKIAHARQFYNDSVLNYKNKIEMFPSNLVAHIFGFKEEPFFEASEEERKNVQVKF